ncbi:uncharacterized protein LOC106865476 [Brachypodium distachyon]|uniref:uncharacterized protein LOC106865476 n=1 Tax=Brachypodium distachyon TaxID=15368 RepID=UPI00071E3FCC|nr:uncharacterized protein LOC106865476 [Brachypodium distachyon]|eukprot:XP_014751021.1 uncharacterized protein LOC106865476 [Brachypodium distachyon]
MYDYLDIRRLLPLQRDAARVQVFGSDDDYACVLLPAFLLNSGQLSTSVGLPSSPVSDVENFESWRSTHGDWNRNDGHLPSPVRGDEEDEDDDDEVPVAEGSEEEAEEVTDDDFSE